MMNDNEPIEVGDRVQLRGFPLQGTVWSMTERNGLVAVVWDNPDQEVYVRRRSLEKITPHSLQAG